MAVNHSHGYSMSLVCSWNEVGEVICQVSSSGVKPPLHAPLLANADTLDRPHRKEFRYKGLGRKTLKRISGNRDTFQSPTITKSIPLELFSRYRRSLFWKLGAIRAQ